MSAREAARRRLVAAMWCGYAAIFLVALAAVALDDDEDQAAAAELVDRCPFDDVPVPLPPEMVDLMSAREVAAYRAGWQERARFERGAEAHYGKG